MIDQNKVCGYTSPFAFASGPVLVPIFSRKGPRSKAASTVTNLIEKIS